MNISRLLLVAALVGLAAFDVRAEDLDRPPIEYYTAKSDDPVARLIRRIQDKEITLHHDREHGYLRSLLNELDVPLSSQVLVFSKTSLQRSRISPRTPRAIYFNDEVSIGFCQRGDVLEVTAMDPDLGVVFYTLDQDPRFAGRFKRQTESCLLCHGSSRNRGFPGHLIRSVAADKTGEMVLARGTRQVDHTTPFAERWGGWYVTGTGGGTEHLGNQVVGGWPGLDETAGGVNITDLKPYFTVGDYPTPHSDLVALLVLEHQCEGQNRIARANYLTRLALYEQGELNRAFGDPEDQERESITRRIRSACEPVVEYLLFSGEAKLTGPVVGTSKFAKEFAARGPVDSKGRSLRQFDLKTRLFRYPLSYLIYTRQFDGLPERAKEDVYRRLWEVLSGQDRSERFAHLSAGDRKAIIEIVRQTKAELPRYWLSN